MVRQSDAAVVAHGGADRSGRGWPARPLPWHRHYSTALYPVALRLTKRGKQCIVGKIVPLDGEPVLAVTVRHQKGTLTTISTPLVALGYALQAGCQWLYYRNDRTTTMRRIRLDTLRRVGWVASSQGIAEQFVRLADMEAVPWRQWVYVEDTVDLDAVKEAHDAPH